jgi:hypothetical protein
MPATIGSGAAVVSEASSSLAIQPETSSASTEIKVEVPGSGSTNQNEKTPATGSITAEPASAENVAAPATAPVTP